MNFKPFKKYLVFSIVSSLVASFAYILAPLHLGFAIDEMNSENQINMDNILKILLIILFCYLIYFVFTFFTNLIATRVSTKYASNLRFNLLKKVNNVSISNLDAEKESIQSQFSNDIESILDAIYLLLTQVFNAIWIVLFVSIFMIQISLLLTIVVFLIVPLVFISSRIIANRSVKRFRTSQELTAKLNAKTSSYIDNHELIMTYNYQSEAINNFEEVNKALNDNHKFAQILSALVNPTTRFFNHLSYVLIGLVGAFAMLNQGLSLGALTSFISFSMIFYKPFDEFSAMSMQLSNGYASYKRVSAILKSADDKDTDKKEVFKGESVVFKDVDFAYLGSKQLFKQLSLDVKPLSKVAIVGPTGAGKSTLMNLLLRFYDPSGGSIYMDHVNLLEVSKDLTRSKIGLVLQEPWLFDGTIKENLLYGNTLASDEMIYETLKQAGCYEMIIALDKGLDTYITSDSNSISLGQRQMITIARALLTNASILVLDEATSNIDVLTEQKIQKVFTDIMKSHTSFFIAHRLSTAYDADLILVMNQGALIEKGTHHELLNLRGFYYDLYMSQMKVQ